MKLVGQEFVIIDDFGWPRNPDGYNKLVKRVAQKAGISDIHPHMFRHPYVKPTTKKFITFFEAFRAAI